MHRRSIPVALPAPAWPPPTSPPSVVSAFRDRAQTLRSAGLLIAVLCLSAPSARLEAQCYVPAPPVNFEPNPPGPAGPRPWLLSPINMNNLALYRNGAGGPWQILMQETFGYSVLGLTNPMSPSVLRWDYLPFDVNGISINGDGQSYVGTIAASPDGQRAALSLNGPGTPPWHTVVGSPDGNSGFRMWGDAPPESSSGTVIQQVGSRYIVYSPVFGGVYATDVTTLPGAFGPSNMISELAPWPGGSKPTLAGTFLVYLASNGAIEIVDVATPGPAGSITGGMAHTFLGSASFAGRSIANVKAAADPSNPKMLWVLAELSAAAGENSPSYGLVSMTEDGAGNFSAPVAAGPLFRVPAQAGETWIPAGNASALASINNTVHVLMWAVRRSPYQAVLYATTTLSWPNAVQNTIVASGFGVSNAMGILPGAGSSVYAYIANGSNAWVLPMSCQAANARAAAFLSAVNASNGGTIVNSGDAVPYGETLTLSPLVLPPPSVKPLTSWLWNFDFDFHAGSFVEDAGAGVSPRLRNPDAGNTATPPPTETLVGPCDPKGVPAGAPPTGANCWASVRNNANQTAGGTAPDFTGAEGPGALTPLTVAFEATNENGSAGPALFTVNWKRPALSLATMQILSGDTLTAVVDGHPQSGGANAWKWYFGTVPSGLTQVSCPAGSCAPAGAHVTPGTHYYWITAPFAQIGYSTPDYAGAPMGTYTVTAFAPIFAVNGVSTGSLAVSAGQALVVSNTSRRGSTTTGTGGYVYCLIPSAQSACNAPDWRTLSIADPQNASTGLPATSTTIPSPGAGSWVLRLKVNYSNPAGTAYWPDPSGTAGLPVTVTDALVVTATVAPNPAPSGTTVLFSCMATGGSGSFGYEWSGQFGSVSQTQTYNLRVTNNGISDLSVSLDCTVTDAVTGSTGTASAFLTVQPPPRPVVTATASPNPAPNGSNVTFSCSATGGSGSGYAYAWAGTSGGTFSTAPSFSQTFTNSTTSNQTSPYTCTVTDGAGNSGTSTVSLVVLPTPLIVSVAATPNPAAIGSPAQLTCSVVGRTGSFVYSWSLSDGTVGAGSPFLHTFGAVGSYSAACTAFEPATGYSGQGSVTVTATLPPGSGGPYVLYMLTPCRVLDTRNPPGQLGGPAIQPAGTPDRSFNVRSACGIPADAKAISANVAVTNVAASGALLLYRGDGQPTAASTASFVQGKTRANNAIVQLALDGSGTVKVHSASAGTLDLILDVNGYFR